MPNGLTAKARPISQAGGSPAAARALPGVVAVLMAEDVPGHNNVGTARHDETLFAADEVLYHGHIVALVVGESLAACR